MDAAVCSSGVHLDKFGLLSTESEAASPASSSSAPLGAPLFFSLTFHFNCPHDGPEFGGSVAALGVAVDFVADVASEKKTVTLLPLTPLSGPQARSGSATANDAFLTAAATDTSPHHSNGLAGPSLGEAADGAPGTVYCLTVRLRNLGALSGIELKHLLQVSVMRVRLAHLGTSEGATAGYSSDSRTEERLLALWNIIWQTNRSTAASMFLGGFVPRRFAQFNRDPWWMFFIFSLGVWIGEYPAMQIKYNARDLILDPHRYVWSHLDDHH